MFYFVRLSCPISLVSDFMLKLDMDGEFPEFIYSYIECMGTNANKTTQAKYTSVLGKNSVGRLEIIGSGSRRPRISVGYRSL